MFTFKTIESSSEGGNPLSADMEEHIICYLNERDVYVKEKCKKNKRIRSMPAENLPE